MADPVVLSDGHTYERAVIEQWLATNDTSPLTGAQLVHKHVISNWALKNMIEDWRRQHNS